MRDDRLYVIHICECIERIENYTEDGAEVFFSDTRAQDAVLRNLHILSESTQRLSQDLGNSKNIIYRKRSIVIPARNMRE